MHWQTHRVNYMKPIPLKKDSHRVKTVERQMFMVERVPLQLLQQVACIHELKAEVPGVSQDLSRSLENCFRVLVVSESVAPGNNICRTIFRPDLLRNRKVKISGDYTQTF